MRVEERSDAVRLGPLLFDNGIRCPLVLERLAAFILDLASLRRILGHLGLAPQQPEPLAHAPPDETELYVENA